MLHFMKLCMYVCVCLSFLLFFFFFFFSSLLFSSLLFAAVDGDLPRSMSSTSDGESVGSAAAVELAKRRLLLTSAGFTTVWRSFVRAFFFFGLLVGSSDVNENSGAR